MPFQKNRNYFMKILLVPTIREIYSNQLELCVDKNLIKFLRFSFGSKIKIKIYDGNILKKFNLIILCGGNDLPNIVKKKSNYFRFSIDNKIYKFGLKKKIPIIGICYGAQFIAFKNKFKIVKKKHVGNHIVFAKSKLNIFRNRKFSVNSFHNYVIKRTSKDTNDICEAEDKTIELFKLKNKKVLGIMWHPERNSKFKNQDKKIFKSFYDISNTFGR